MKKKIINFCGYTWLTQERWGRIHPEKKYVWYDDEAVVQFSEDSEDELILLSRYNPRYFSEINGVSPMGVGLISSTEKFSYGTFELEAKLPNMAYSWPAFWMWSWTDWPPEIDVFEGYSNSRGTYSTSIIDQFFKGIYFNVKTNIHLKDTEKKWDIGDQAHYFGLRRENPMHVFIKYKLIWKPNLIQFFYNDTLVREITDLSILSLINGHGMNVIINNSLYKQHSNHKKMVGQMFIKNFKYTPL